MELSFTFENGLKKVIIANIVALVLSIGTLVWNLSATHNQIQRMQQNQQHLQDTQGTLLREQREHSGRINNLEAETDQIRGDVSRLEDFHFNVGGSDVGDRSSPRRAAGGSFRIPERLPEESGRAGLGG